MVLRGGTISRSFSLGKRVFPDRWEVCHETLCFPSPNELDFGDFVKNDADFIGKQVDPERGSRVAKTVQNIMYFELNLLDIQTAHPPVEDHF